MEKKKHQQSTWFESIMRWILITALNIAISFIVIFVVGVILFATYDGNFTRAPTPPIVHTNLKAMSDFIGQNLQLIWGLSAGLSSWIALHIMRTNPLLLILLLSVTMTLAISIGAYFGGAHLYQMSLIP